MSNTNFYTPFCSEYWKSALKEFKKVNILVFAALMIALRVALKAIEIPVGPSLYITTGFFVNALGSMIYGPIVAIFAAAVSDTLGCLLFPTGPYFFPFIFVEIASSLIFALFLYRSKITTWRIISSRFAVMVVCNLILNPVFIILYNKLFLGKEYAFLSLPRIIKNLCLFPLEAFLLVIFFNVMLPITKQMNLTTQNNNKMKFSKRHVITLILMAILSAVAVAFYGFYKTNLK